MFLIILALKNLWRNKRRTLFFETTIVFGMMVVIFTGAFLQGWFRFWVFEKFVNTTSGAFQVEHIDYRDKSKLDPLRATIRNSTELIAKIEKIPRIIAASGELRIAGIVSNGTKSAVFDGLGVDKNKRTHVLPGSKVFLKEGRQLGNNPNDIILGRFLAEKVGIHAGDQIAIVVKTLHGGIDLVYGNVVGIKDGDHFPSATYLEMNLFSAQKLLRLPDRVSQILVRADDFDKFLKYARIVESILQKAGYPIIVRDYTEFVVMYSTVSRVFKLIALVISIILFIIVGLGITNTMFMAVRERRKEIGTILAIGMESSQVRSLFIMEGIWMGLAGTIFGMIFIWLIINVFSYTGIPIPALGSKDIVGTIILYPKMDWFVVTVTYITALVISILASWLPASVSAKLDPVQALREG